MSQILKFMEFIRDRGYALEDLEQFNELIAIIEYPDGERGYKLKPLLETSRVTQRCQNLIQYTWACRDYVKKILEDAGLSNSGEMVNPYIDASLEIQAISYMANEYKHSGIDANKQRWGIDLMPRLGKPYVLGVQTVFPFNMKPVFFMSGDSLPGVEVSMKVSVGDQAFQDTSYDWMYSCMIDDKDGNQIGETRDICDKAFGIWLRILNDSGIVVQNAEKAPLAEAHEAS